MTDERYPEEIDPEIAEIFVEEATEVIETLETHFPRWQQSPAEREPLAEIRRAFHTLKGSGRMVGAETVGDLAWSIENLLNRVTDAAIAVSPTVIEAVDRARQMLPGLVEAFATRAPVDLRAVSGLQEVVHALARNEVVAFPEAAEALEEALREPVIEPAAEELVAAPEEVEAPAVEAPAPEFEIEETTEAETPSEEEQAEDWLSRVLAEQPASESAEPAEPEFEAAGVEATEDWLSRQTSEETEESVYELEDSGSAPPEEVESWLSELMPGETAEAAGQESLEEAAEEAFELPLEEAEEQPLEAAATLPAEDVAEAPLSAEAEGIADAAGLQLGGESIEELPQEPARLPAEEPETHEPEPETPVLDVAARAAEPEPEAEPVVTARHAEELAWTKAVQDLARRRALEMRQMRRTRLKLATILLAPLLVIALATLVFYTGIGIPKATTNRGELLYPPLHMDDLSWRDDAGEPWTYAGAAPGWSLLVVGSGDCGEECRERLYLTRQIRTALGKDASRVSRYFVNLDPAQTEDFSRYLAAEQVDLDVLHVDAARLRAWLGKPGGFDPVEDRLILMADPRGYLMMYYAPTHVGRDTIEDMRFLLKHSYENVR